VDWPGWCRRGKGEDAALATLIDYADRYATVAATAFGGATPQVIGRVPGDATTDFGAPGTVGPWDEEPWSGKEATRLVGLLHQGCWRAFDAAAAAAPAVLPKGPRGGGRDRDGIIEHVREAERSYGRKVGVRVPPRTPWADQRAAISRALRDEEEPGATRWPRRYLVRRAAWHVLDNAWELEDKSAR
jgi:hypothetical protein